MASPTSARPSSISNPFFWYWLALASLLISALLIFLILRSRPKKILSAKSAYDLALEQLDKARALLREDEADCLTPSWSRKRSAPTSASAFRHLRPVAPRRNFSARWKLTAPTPLADHRNLLREFLQSCDLVKFARYQPTLADSNWCSSAPPNFVTATKPLPDPAHSNGRPHEPGPIRLPVGAFVCCSCCPFSPFLRVIAARRPAIEYSGLSLFTGLGRARKVQAGGWLSALRYFVLFWCIIALARPQKVESSTQVQESGIDMILAIDSLAVDGGARLSQERRGTQPRASRARDGGRFHPGTAQRSHRHGRLLRRSLPDEPVDARPRLASAKRGASPQPGRGSVTRRPSGRPSPSRQSPARRESKSKIIVLLTDGANNAGKITPLAAAEAAHALGIKIYTIARAHPTWPNFPAWIRLAASPTPRFQSIIDNAALQKIADIGGGKFFRAADLRYAQACLPGINQLETTKVAVKHFHKVKEYFVLGALSRAAFFGIRNRVSGTPVSGECRE